MEENRRLIPYINIFLLLHFSALFDRKRESEKSQGERGDDPEQRASGLTRTQAAAIRTQP